SLEEAVVACHLHFMAGYPDSLIARKRGQAEAEEAAQRACQVLQEGWPANLAGQAALADFDAWLRAGGRGRNPRTTSDLVTACLFAALRDGIIKMPCPTPWSAGPHHG